MLGVCHQICSVRLGSLSFSSNSIGYFKKPRLLLVHDHLNRYLCSIPWLCSWLRTWFLPVFWFLVHLQACRALMILSLLVGLASIVVSVLGLKCTKLGRTSERVKDQMALSGGILFILSGMWPRTEMLCPQPDGFIVHNCWTCQIQLVLMMGTFWFLFLLELQYLKISVSCDVSVHCYMIRILNQTSEDVLNHLMSGSSLLHESTDY